MKKVFLSIVFINTFSLFLGLGVSNVYADLEAGEAIAGPVIDMYNSTADPDCPEANPATGISYVCGYVKSNTVEHKVPGDVESSRITGKPIVGAVVSVCKALATPTGKTSDGSGGQLDCTNAYRGVTNDLGFFKVPVPMVGAAANTIYTVVSCNGAPVYYKKLTSVYSHLMPLKLNCPTDLTPIKPPDKIEMGNSRTTYLTCDTPGLTTVVENAAERILSSIFSQPVGYSKPFEDRTDTIHYERQFDLRYKCLGRSQYCSGAEAFILPEHDGAWWSYDCVRRPDGRQSSGALLECFTDLPPTDYGQSSWWTSPPVQVNIYDTGNITPALERYMIQNTLDTLPLDPAMPLYRRYEHRYGMLGLQQFASAPASFVQNMFGNCVSYVRHLKNGEQPSNEMLMSCDNFKLCKQVISEDKTKPINSYITGGPAVGLSSPENWEEIYNKIVREDRERSDENKFMNTVVCQQNGDPITIAQIEPPTNWLSINRAGSYRLDEDYFHPFILLDKYPGVENKTADSNHNSPQDGSWLPRNIQYGLVATEAGPDNTALGVQDGSPHSVVIPEDPSHASSVGTAFSITQDDAYIEGGALTDTLALPVEDEEEVVPDDNIEWDIGMGLMNHCSKPDYAGDTGVSLIDNTVEAILNPETDPQVTDDTVSTQVYYTAFSLARDRLLEAHRTNDLVDSYMSIFEADDDKIAMSTVLAADVWGQIVYWIENSSRLLIHGSGPQKSFYHRVSMGGVKILGLQIDYSSLNEDNFGEVFRSGSLRENPDGTGAPSVGHVEYPWREEVDACNAWGNQYYGMSNGVDLCNNDPNCLRTCRLHTAEVQHTRENGNVTSFSGGCLRLWNEKDYSYNLTSYACVEGDTQLRMRSCTTEEKFNCVLKGRTEFPEPPPVEVPNFTNPLNYCCDGTGYPAVCENRTYTGDSVYWCVVDHAGPFQGTFDLDDQAAHFRSQQKLSPKMVAIGKEQKPLDNIVDDGNYWVDAMRAPYTPKKQIMGAALSFYDNNKRGGVAMSGKDTVRVGDTGATDYFTSIAADPIFNDTGVDDDPDSPLQTEESSVAATPVPEVTVEDVTRMIDSSCAVTSCNLRDTSKFVPTNDYSALYQILSAAGSAYHVPAKLLITFMYAEGTLAKYDWNDANTYRWSIPIGGTVKRNDVSSLCDDLTWADVGVVPKFLNAWNGGPNPTAGCSGDPFNTSDPIKCGVDAIAQGRGSVARRCNLLDAAFAFAKDAWQTGGQPGSCGEWDVDRYSRVINQWAVTGGLGGTTAGDAYNNQMWEPINACN